MFTTRYCVEDQKNIEKEGRSPQVLGVHQHGWETNYFSACVRIVIRLAMCWQILHGFGLFLNDGPKMLHHRYSLQESATCTLGFGYSVASLNDFLALPSLGLQRVPEAQWSCWRLQAHSLHVQYMKAAYRAQKILCHWVIFVIHLVLCSTL